MGVMGGAGRQGAEGGDHRCRAEPAPQPTRSRSAGAEESAADAALAPRNLSPFPGDGAGPRSSSGDALPAATQETRGQRGGFAKPAPRTRPVLYPGGAPRPRRHDTHSRDSPPLRGLHAAQVKENENLSVAPSAGKQRPPTHCFTCRETTQQARSTTKGT